MAYIFKPPKQNKPSSNKKLAQKYVYNTDRWSRLRNVKLKNNPLCEECFTNEIITPAVEVHHITPFMTGISIEQIKWLGFDYNNLMSLCSDCHKKKHTKNNKEE